MPDTTTYTFVPFVAKSDRSSRLIEGPITADVVDVDGQKMSPEWLKAALPAWMQYGNIREQHNPQRPVGKAQTLDMSQISEPRIVARITDDRCWQGIEDGIFSGFSLGIRNARFMHDGSAPRGTIVGGDIIEVSVVDHPAVRKAAFTIVAKAAGGWKDMQTGNTIEDATQEERMSAYEASLAPDVEKGLTQAERNKIPADEFAGPHRSFPIDSEAHVEAAAHLVGKAEDPEAVKAKIIRLAKKKKLKLPAAWKEKDVQKMPDMFDEEGNPLFKSAGTDRPEDNKPAAPKGDHADARDDDEDEDGDEDEDDDDAFKCPRCHKDARHCECYKSTNKAAGDFESAEGNTRPIKPGHPVTKGHSTAVGAHSAMYDGSKNTEPSTPFSSADAAVRLDYAIKSAEHLVSRMQAALDGLNKAGWSPNDDSTHAKSQPAGDPNEGMGRLPTDRQQWHGQHAETGNLVNKGVDEAEVYKIAADVCTVALQEFFADTGFITKGASTDTTKAALADLITNISQDVTAHAVSQIEARLAKVEKMPMPSKGVAAQAIASQVPTRTYHDLAPQERHVVDAEIAKSVGNLSDTERSQLLASFLAQDMMAGRNQVPYA